MEEQTILSCRAAIGIGVESKSTLTRFMQPNTPQPRPRSPQQVQVELLREADRVPVPHGDAPPHDLHNLFEARSRDPHMQSFPQPLSDTPIVNIQ